MSSSLYYGAISRILRATKRPDVRPEHAEGFMRSAHGGTLDHLTLIDFRRAVIEAVACVDEAGLDVADDIARSYGLGTPSEGDRPVGLIEARRRSREAKP